MDIQVFESERYFFLRFSHVSSPFFPGRWGRAKENQPQNTQKGNCHREPDDKLLDVPAFSQSFSQHFPAFSHGFSHGFSVSGSPAGSRQITWRATAFAVALVRNRSNGQSVIFIGINGELYD